MIDFHTHILPGMDDGAENVSVSLEMLNAAIRQGISHVVLTPHFSAYREYPDRFLKRRSQSANLLRESMPENSPLLFMGAEVQYFSGIAAMDSVRNLCVSGTDLLLLEMPVCRWSLGMIDELLELNSRNDLKIMVAHIERCIGQQGTGVMEELIRSGVMLQANCRTFLSPFARRKVLRWLKTGWIHALGTDCHGNDKRKVNMEPCVSLIERKLGRDCSERLNQIGRELLCGAVPLNREAERNDIFE